MFVVPFCGNYNEFCFNSEHGQLKSPPDTALLGMLLKLCSVFSFYFCVFVDTFIMFLCIYLPSQLVVLIMLLSQQPLGYMFAFSTGLLNMSIVIISNNVDIIIFI